MTVLERLEASTHADLSWVKSLLSFEVDEWTQEIGDTEVLDVFVSLKRLSEIVSQWLEEAREEGRREALASVAKGAGGEGG